ncbi:hypothetical protein ABTL57_19095, partial [Acinetobacter baumannii]
MNQFDLVASPMRTDFVKGTPPKDNFKPWTHVLNQIPLDQGVTPGTSIESDLAKAWQQAKKRIFKGRSTKPDSEDADTVNHLTWYEAT